MNTRSLDRLREVHALVRRAQRSLEAEQYAIPELEPAISQARYHVGHLERWIEEMNWIADTELQSRKRSSRTN